MKHIQLYEAFEESKLPQGVQEISSDDFDKMLLYYKSGPIQEVDREKLERICDLANFRRRERINDRGEFIIVNTAWIGQDHVDSLISSSYVQTYSFPAPYGDLKLYHLEK